jgi:hypothetical protein
MPLGAGALYTPGGGTVEVRRSSFIGNQSDTGGAAIVSGSPLLVTDSVFTGNSRSGFAGNAGGGAVTIDYAPGLRRFVNTTFTCNQTNGDGGALFANGPFSDYDLQVESCTFAGNTAFGGSGGALAVAFRAVGRITNSTFVDNVAGLDGGALASNTAFLDLANVTVTRNVAGGSGGGLGGGTFRLRDTLVAGNTAGGQPSDCVNMTTFGHNLLGTTRGCYIVNGIEFGVPAPGDVFGPADGTPIDPRIAPLAAATCETTLVAGCTVAPVGPLPANACALAPGSPAVDAGESTGCTDFDGMPIASDGRGRAREDGNDDGQVRCDIGACEGTDGVLPATTTSTSTTTTTFPFFGGDPTGEAPPPTTSTTTATTPATTTTTGTTAPPATTTTSTTLAPLIEICGNCIDDDGNGLVDFEDPACCADTQPLALKKSRLKPVGANSALSVKGSLGRVSLGTFPPATRDVFFQLRIDDGAETLCAQIPAARFTGKKKTLVFRDKTGVVQSAKGLQRIKLRLRKDGSVLVVMRGKQVRMATPPAGRLGLMLGLRDPATAEDGNQCRGTTQAFRAVGKKGALRFP